VSNFVDGVNEFATTNMNPLGSFTSYIRNGSN